MSDENNAADAGGERPISTVTADKDTPKTLDPREAMRALQDARRKRDDTPNTEAAPKPAAPEKSAPKTPASAGSEADAAAPQEPTGETQEDAPEDAASPKPRDLPRSWTRDQHDQWAKLDPELQEFLLEQDSKASAAVRRVQNEAAEKLKQLAVREQAVEQARQQYEQALPTLMQSLQNQVAGQFADIRSMADVEKMAAEDWPRYIQWDAAQKKLAAVSAEAQATYQRQSQEFQQSWTKWTADQDKAFLEKAPEMADPVKSAKVRDAAIKTLKDIGFSEEELGQLWNGGQLRDHRIQLLIRDATLYRESKAAGTKPLPKPVPQVQRPGVSRPRGADNVEIVDALTEKLNKTGNAKDAAALLTARRAGR